MTIAAQITAIQTVNAGITGITSAPTTIPGSLNTADLPMMLVFVGPGRPEKDSGSLAIHFRDYYIRCYVKPVSQDIKPDAGYSLAYTLLQRVIDEYLSDITFGGAIAHMGTGSRYSPPTMEDGGIQAMEYAGTLYHGFEILITTKEIL